MKINFIDLNKQYQLYKNEFQEAINKVLDTSSYINGPEVKELEIKLAEFVNVKYAISTSSGTDALYLALLARGIKEGDEIITSPFTFFATVEVILWLGAKPVFIDIDEKTYNIDISLIEKSITNRTKAIIPVDLYGQCCNYPEIMKIADKHNLFVLEDAAQSFGATFKDHKACSFGHASATSFYPPKPLGCYGDGGMVFTNNTELAENIRSLKDHGQSRRYYHDYIGINGRLDTIQAAILLVKLKHLDEELEKRQLVAKYYSDNLKNHVITPHISQDNKSAYAQYTIRVKNRDNFIKYLNENNIPTAIHYPVPIYLQPALKDLNYKKGLCRNTETISEEVVSLPFHPFLSHEEQDFIIEHIIKATKE